MARYPLLIEAQALGVALLTVIKVFLAPRPFGFAEMTVREPVPSPFGQEITAWVDSIYGATSRIPEMKEELLRERALQKGDLIP